MRLTFSSFIGRHASTPLAFAVAMWCAAPFAAADAQTVVPDRTALTLAEVRACAPAQCQLTLERGTLRGTQLRIGTPGTMTGIGFTGGRAFKQVSVVPEARAEAGKARSALRSRLLVATATLAGVGLVFAQTLDKQGYQQNSYGTKPTSEIPKQIGIAALVGATGLFIYTRLGRSADRHLERAVEAYNRELPR